MTKYIAITTMLLWSYKMHGQVTHQFTVAVNQPSDCSAVTSIDEPIRFKVFPNPVSSSFSIQSEISDAIFILVDLNGKEVLSGKLEVGNLIVNVKDIKSGMYILHLSSNKMCEQTKILIQ